MAILSLVNAGRRVGGRWVLWDVSLEVEPGEILGIFGRSDSGKTALARVITGLDEPTSGSVHRPASDASTGSGCTPPTDRGDGSALRVSFASNAPAAAAELSIYENLGMFASLWGLRGRARAKDIAFLLELVGLAGQRAMRPGELSSGAMRRFEIARALVAGSPLTVVDCLLDALDRDALERIWDHILELRRAKGRSFVVMTASAKVAELCGRLAVMHNGKIAFIGRPEDFRRLGGEDMVVLGDLANPALRSRIEERLQVVIKEEEGYLSFRVANGERMISDILAELGSDVGCVYLKRPTLDDALSALAGGGAAATVVAHGGEA